MKRKPGCKVRSIYCTEKQWKIIERKAKASDCRSTSAFIIKTLLEYQDATKNDSGSSEENAQPTTPD